MNEVMISNPTEDNLTQEEHGGATLKKLVHNPTEDMLTQGDADGTEVEKEYPTPTEAAKLKRGRMKTWVPVQLVRQSNRIPRDGKSIMDRAQELLELKNLDKQKGHLAQAVSLIKALETYLSHEESANTGKSSSVPGDEGAGSSPNPALLKKRKLLLAGPKTPQASGSRRVLIPCSIHCSPGLACVSRRCVAVPRVWLISQSCRSTGTFGVLV